MMSNVLAQVSGWIVLVLTQRVTTGREAGVEGLGCLLLVQFAICQPLKTMGLCVPGRSTSS